MPSHGRRVPQIHGAWIFHASVESSRKNSQGALEVFREGLETARKFDQMRHELIPYLYSTACESHLEGVPMLRPLLLEYPKDLTARNQELSCMIGEVF